MDRYSATRLVLRICILAISASPARGQVQVGDLMVTQETDGVTVTLAQASQDTPQDAQQNTPQDAQQNTQQDRQQYPQQYPQQDSRQLAQQDPQQDQPPGTLPQQQERDGAAAQPVPRITITHVTLSSDDLPPAALPVPSARPLPPMPAPHSHEMERDVLTLKAAHAAMLLDDQLHQHNKLASLR